MADEQRESHGSNEDWGAEAFLSFDSYEELMAHLYGPDEDQDPDVESASKESFKTKKKPGLMRVNRKAHGGAADPTSSIQQANTMRRAAAMELRAQGFSYRQIAEQLNYYSAEEARAAVLRGLDRLVVEPGRELLVMEVYRLDQLMSVIFPMAMDGNLKAVDRVLKIQERRAKYLGLDAPKTTDIRVTVQEEIRQLAQQYDIDESLITEIEVESKLVIRDET